MAKGESISPPRPSGRSRSLSTSRRSRSRSQDSVGAINPGNTLHVAGLSPRVTETDLEKHFSREGKMAKGESISPPRPSRRSRRLSRSRRSRSRSRDSEGAINPGNTLHMAGLSTRVTETGLKEHFSHEGNVVECHLVRNPHSKESRGFVFVTMEAIKDAERCIETLNRSVMKGRLITVEKAKRKQRRTPTPRQYEGHKDMLTMAKGESISPPRPSGRSRSLSRSRRSRCRGRDSVGAINPGNTLHVAGLSTRVSETDLEKHFSREGKVVECHLVKNPDSNESRGFAFVTMETIKDAERCIEKLNRSVMKGRLITVGKAKRKRGRTPTPGQYEGLKDKRGSGWNRRRSRSYSPRRRHDRDSDPRERRGRRPSTHGSRGGDDTSHSHSHRRRRDNS